MAARTSGVRLIPEGDVFKHHKEAGPGYTQLHKQPYQIGYGKRASAYVHMAGTFVLWTAGREVWCITSEKRARMRGDGNIHWNNRSAHLPFRRSVALLRRRPCSPP